MKAFLLVVALAVIPACGQGNDVATVQHEAVALTKYYRPQVEALEKRIGAIFDRGHKIPGNLPGIQDVGRRLQEAREVLAKTRLLLDGSKTQKSLDQEAEEAAKAGNVEALEKLVAESEEALVSGVTIVNDDLLASESWLKQYDRGMLAMAQPAPAQVTEPVPPTEAAPAPGETAPAPTAPVNTPQTGQPAGAQQAAPHP